MNKKTLLLPMLIACAPAIAQVASVSSPDGKLKVNVDVKDGKPVYEVLYDGKQMLDNSPLGFIADNGDYTQNISFVGKGEAHFEFNYDLRVSKFSNVHVNANQLKVQMKNAKGNLFDIDFRVSNNDVAFRYSIPNHASKANGKKFSIRILKEATGFDFPSQTTTFLTPQSHAMVG